MMEEADDSFYSSSVSSSASPRRTPELRLSETIENIAVNQPLDDPLANTEIVHYQALEHHWFYSKAIGDRVTWLPMSMKDSTRIEEVYSKNKPEIQRLRALSEIERGQSKHIISIKGGRFDVDLVALQKHAVYWTEEQTSQVCRCLWFYKESNEQQFLPYTEEYSDFLEKEYEKTIKNNTFHKRIDFLKSVSPTRPVRQSSVSSEEAFVFHSTSIMLHFTQATMLDEFGNLNSDAQRPRVVKRGLTEVVDKVEADETEQVDHLCFVVHGIGEACDLKFRPIVECVDDFRHIGGYIAQSHLKTLIDTKQIHGRVEFLPISWHQDLHGDSTGIDEHLKPITLPSIPKLREFSNSTILDVLFYTSPIYCQTIISKVGTELNRLSQVFRERNPDFKGTISLVGHSLGSLICFDLLSNQIDGSKSETRTGAGGGGSGSGVSESIEDILNQAGLSHHLDIFKKENITAENLWLINEADLIQLGLPLGSRRVLLHQIKSRAFKKSKEDLQQQIEINLNKLPISSTAKNGLAGTGQIMVAYPQLNFPVSKFFALGSPIPMFQTVRGIEKIDPDFKLPTCGEFYNIFHPFDPVAYRFEPLVCPSPVLKPVLMPHHKGRKRMHIELREGLTKVGGDMMKVGGDIIKNAWSTFSDTQAFFKKLPMSTTNMIEAAPSETAAALASETKISHKNELTAHEEVPSTSTAESEKPPDERLCNFGRINNGKRIDYVLQESPFESFNDYLFALASHACYWESEDTLLMIVKQLYGCEDMLDANVELNLTETQQQQTSWLTQMASQTLSSNVQKTFSYFQMGLPQSLTNVLPTTSSTNK